MDIPLRRGLGGGKDLVCSSPLPPPEGDIL